MGRTAVYKERSALTGMQVKEAMQKIVIRLPHKTSVQSCVRTLLKTKSNIIVVDDGNGVPAGTVTKSDIMNAYYAGFPIETELSEIMMGPLLFCTPEDRIEDVIDTMQRDGVHRIFVKGIDSTDILGTLEYVDIVGLLYRYCRVCEKSKWVTAKTVETSPLNLKVSDAMVGETAACYEGDPIYKVVEELITTGSGAALIADSSYKPKGVVTKTDLSVAFIHGVTTDYAAAVVMATPVAYCNSDIMLTDAIQQMYILDTQQLFVQHPATLTIIGQLTIDKAAQFRSGTCKACIASLMLDRV